MNVTDKLATFAILLASVVGFVVALASPKFFQNVYAREDGMIEWATVAALVVGALICIRRLLRHRRTASRGFLLVTALLAVLFVFVAGEELSWGQRLLRIDSPEFFKRYNFQAETNLHNTAPEIVSVLMGAIPFLHLVVLPWCFRRSAAARTFANRNGLPVPRLHHIVIFFASTLLIAGTPAAERWEIWEFTEAATLAVVACFPLNLDRLGRPAGDAA